MDDVNWESVKMKANSVIEGDVDGVIPSDVRSLASMLLQTGDNNPEQREPLSGSIKAMLKGFHSGQAVYRWGNHGLLPAAAGVIVESAAEIIREAAHRFFTETQQYSQPLLRKHGKSKGSPVYIDADEYAASLASKARSAARDLYKNGEWDGTVEGLANCAEYEYVEEEE